MEGIEKGKFQAAKKDNELNINVKILPKLPKDSTDRNRTSPFAFTGNKFEFRMVGSSASIAAANIVLNTITAAVLDEVATKLEKADKKNLDKVIQDVLVELIKNHKKVVFNGNNYSDDWVKEAEKRGLPNVKTTPDALKAYISKEVLAVFEKYKVLSHREMESRYEIYVETYSKHVNIEALTMIDMANKLFIPSVSDYLQTEVDLVLSIEGAGLTNKKVRARTEELNKNLETMIDAADKLEKATKAAQAEGNQEKKAALYRDKVIPAMAALRSIVDA